MDVSTRTLPEGFRLDRGAHKSPGDGMCLVEAAAYVAGRPHTDHPPCVSPVIGAFCRSWNDSLSDEDRQMLVPYVERILDTNTGPGDDEKRAWLATDWLVRECAPAWLRLAGLTTVADITRARLAAVADRVGGGLEVVLESPDIR